MSNRQEDDDTESDSREHDRDANEETAPSVKASDEVAKARGILEAIAASARSQLDPRALASMLAASEHATNLVSAQVAEIVSRLDLASTQTALAQYARFTEQWASLTRASDYAKPDPPQSTYSSQMTSAGSYFQADELEIDSVDDLHTAITTLITKTPDLPLVWRGVRDANWGMHSHLFRHLMRVNGVVPPNLEPKGSQPYPDRPDGHCGAGYPPSCT